MKKTWEKQTVLERIDGVSKANLRDLVDVDSITFRKRTNRPNARRRFIQNRD